jgi:hypothetical protein
MNRKLCALIVVIGMCCGTIAAQGQENKSGSIFSEWLKSLQQKIAQIAPKKTLPQTTMVAGVRGAKEDATVKLYWKGKKTDEAVTEEELENFRQGVDLAAKGDAAGAVKGLEDFMKKFPDSALVPDAKKTLDLVKAEPVMQKKTEPKEEKTEEKKEEAKPEAKAAEEGAQHPGDGNGPSEKTEAGRRALP